MLTELLQSSPSGEYICLQNLDLFTNSESQELATQAGKNRHLKIISSKSENNRIKVCLCEDNYPGWLSLDNLLHLQPTKKPYQKKSFSRSQIEVKIPLVIDFTLRAMNTPNYYLWGGTVAPNYDCSGLVQSAYSSVGIWLPRDSYQQEAFSSRIGVEELETGDLIFFGKKKVTHVALYLDNKRYIHSSGKAMGNNGIAINKLESNLDTVSNNYYQEFWSCGRVMKSF